jgi:enamine deaminase RidA (YjgF/YER057c/UK114 family)
MTVEHINPAGMAVNPVYSQGVAVSGNVKTIYVGGQNGGDGDLAAQTAQALRNVGLVLKAADADFTNVIKWNLAIVAGQDLRRAFAAFQAEVPQMSPPPAVGMAYVAGLARPEFLIEIEAIAVVP